MPNFEAALAQLEKSKDNSGLPSWETLSQMQNSKDNKSGLLPNFDLLLQQQLSQNSKEGSKSALQNWEALTQLGLPNSKEALKNLPPGMPNLDLLLQLQLSKDNNSKGIPNWDALALAQMQMAQGQMGEKSQSKHQQGGGGAMQNFDVLAQLQSFKDNKKMPHGLPNFEALALAQLQLAQSVKESKNLSGLSNFEAQLGQNLKDSYSKNFGNFETLAQLHMGKNSKESKMTNFEALAKLQEKQNFDLGKDSKGMMPSFDAFAHLAQKDGGNKNLLSNFNFESLAQLQMAQNSKDKGAGGSLPPFPNFEALALAQLQMSQGKDKNAFAGLPNFEALAKFQMGVNSKDSLKNLSGIPNYESLQLSQNQKDLQSKGGDWESMDMSNKDGKK